MVLMIGAGAAAAASAVECARDVDRGLDTQRALTAGLAEVLEASLVDDPGAENLRVADLQRVLGGLRVVGLGAQAEAPDAIVRLRVAEVLVARGERVVLGELIVEARAYIGAPTWGGNGSGGQYKGDGIDRVHRGQIVDVAPLGIDE